MMVHVGSLTHEAVVDTHRAHRHGKRRVEADFSAGKVDIGHYRRSPLAFGSHAETHNFARHRLALHFIAVAVEKHYVYPCADTQIQGGIVLPCKAHFRACLEHLLVIVAVGRAQFHAALIACRYYRSQRGIVIQFIVRKMFYLIGKQRERDAEQYRIPALRRFEKIAVAKAFHSVGGQQCLLRAAHKGIFHEHRVAHIESDTAGIHEANLVEIPLRSGGHIYIGVVRAGDGNQRQTYASGLYSVFHPHRADMLAVAVEPYSHRLHNVERQHAAAGRGHHAEPGFRTGRIVVVDIADADYRVGSDRRADNLRESSVVRQILVGDIAQILNPRAYAYHVDQLVDRAAAPHESLAVFEIIFAVGVILLP